METKRRQALIGPDLFIQGDVRNGDEVLIQGYLEGSLSARHVIVQPGGRVYGTLVADSAMVEGEVQGNVLVRQLIQIASTGAVRGDVRYGRIAMQAGAELSADVRNVPPAIAGDLSLTVQRGGSVRVTEEDLTAIDPDSPAQSLVYAVSANANGHVARTADPSTSIGHFTQAELRDGGILFVHDGSGGTTVSFDVSVTDDAGASSGVKTVSVVVF